MDYEAVLKRLPWTHWHYLRRAQCRGSRQKWAQPSCERGLFAYRTSFDLRGRHLIQHTFRGNFNNLQRPQRLAVVIFMISFCLIPCASYLLGRKLCTWLTHWLLWLPSRGWIPWLPGFDGQWGLSSKFQQESSKQIVFNYSPPELSAEGTDRNTHHPVSSERGLFAYFKSAAWESGFQSVWI